MLRHAVFAIACLGTACAAPPPAGSVVTLAAPATTFDPPGTAPVIKGITLTPDHIDKGGTITLKVEASAQGGRALTFQWFANKGQITPNGETATWTPAKADGSFEPGLATVGAVVSDGGGSNTPTKVLRIAADGSATLEGAATGAAD